MRAVVEEGGGFPTRLFASETCRGQTHFSRIAVTRRNLNPLSACSVCGSVLSPSHYVPSIFAAHMSLLSHVRQTYTHMICHHSHPCRLGCMPYSDLPPRRNRLPPLRLKPTHHSRHPEKY